MYRCMCEWAVATAALMKHRRGQLWRQQQRRQLKQRQRPLLGLGGGMSIIFAQMAVFERYTGSDLLLL